MRRCPFCGGKMYRPAHVCTSCGKQSDAVGSRRSGFWFAFCTIACAILFVLFLAVLLLKEQLF